ncbi:DUF1642 domain-containing protein [Lacticaseibacillus paracasei]|uniref:DUF1642 domain-containing protein n=1 Tax=Lacticaseibacillus paracasei TaxID=1597 RepID=UPI000FF55921|nr:DUF1642 domain-containing protein [Lacticaseibacillus paracasei]RND57065.1 hypothetical protein FAM18119_01601 [Lacticaseibacillus paracasei]
MNEEKLYAVKNAKGRYLSFSDDQHYRWREGQIAATTSQRIAHDLCTEHGGHVVTLIEEPEKVVLTKEQAEIVEGANKSQYPATYISNYTNAYYVEESLLINAYVNGYTVAKEKKYNVKVPHTKDVWYYKESEAYLLTICLVDKKLRGTFTEAEIEHYGLQDCEKEEVTDDGIR